MTVKITSKQEARLGDLFKEALRELGFNKDEAQEIIKSGGTLKAEVTPILQRLAMVDQRFGPAVSDFTFTVPADYNHDQQIDRFAATRKGQKTTYYFNDALTSANFAKATSKLVPGKTYRARIFPILQTVTSDDCLIFLRKQKAILVGGQGVTLVQDLKSEEFPKGKWTVSFDEKKALWEDAGGHRRVPDVRRYSDGDWEFLLGDFVYGWGDDDCLLCVCDIE